IRDFHVTGVQTCALPILLVERESGEVMWRALNNSAWLGNSYLSETNPAAFGLYQRGRDFESYQDAGAHYERRPSLRVEPIGAWRSEERRVGKARRRRVEE